MALELPTRPLAVRGARARPRRRVVATLTRLADRARRSPDARDAQRIGELLDGLAGAGWLTLHDLSGAIDHIAIGPAGTFAIAASPRRGHADRARVGGRLLGRVAADCRGVQELAGVAIEPLLVLSDKPVLAQPPSRSRGVLVLSAGMLAPHLATRQRVLTVEQVRERYARILAALSGV